MTPMDNVKTKKNSLLNIARFNSAVKSSTNSPLVKKRSEVRSRSKTDLKNQWGFAVKEIRRNSMTALPRSEMSEYERT